MLADRMFTRILLKATSVVRLLRTDSCIPEFPHIIDVSSVASLARNIVEAYDVFYHLAIEKVPHEMYEFRTYLYTLHQVTEHDKIYTSFGRHAPFFGSLSFVGQFCRMQLEKNAVFRSLSEAQRKDLLKGKRPFLSVSVSPLKARFSDQQVLQGLYKLMSNSVHSHPLAVQTFGVADRNDHLSTQHLLDMSVAVATQHLAFAIDDYHRSRRRGRSITASEKRYVGSQTQFGPPLDPVTYGPT
jgi:hypothetical protein